MGGSRNWMGVSLVVSLLVNTAVISLLVGNAFHSHRTSVPATPATATSSIAKAPYEESQQPADRILAGRLPSSIQCAMRGHRGRIEELAYSHDGKMLAVEADNGFLTIWSLSEKRIIRESMIVATGAGIISLWNPTPGEIPREWRHDFENLGPTMPCIRHLAFSPDGRLLAYTCFFSSVAPAGRSLVRTLEIASGRQRTMPEDFSEEIKGETTSLNFAPDGKTLAVSTRNGIALLDPRLGRLKASLQKNGQLFYANLAFATGTANLLACSSRPSGVLIFDIVTGRAISALENKKDGNRVLRNTNMVVFSPNNKYVAASTDDNEVTLWEITSGKRILDIKEGLRSSSSDGRCCITFTPDGASLLTASQGSDLSRIFARRRDLSTGRLITQIELPQLSKDLVECNVYPRFFDLGGSALASVGEMEVDATWETHPVGDSRHCEGVIVIYDTARLVGIPLTSVGSEQ